MPGDGGIGCAAPLADGQQPESPLADSRSLGSSLTRKYVEKQKGKMQSFSPNTHGKVAMGVYGCYKA